MSVFGARDHGNKDLRGAGRQQRGPTGRYGRAGGEDIVDQQDPCAGRGNAAEGAAHVA